MAELVRQLSETDRLLCPRSMGPWHDAAHAVAVRFQDAVYDGLKPFRDEDGELPEGNEAGRAADDAVHGDLVTDRMWLMKDSTAFAYAGRYTTVETYWWECRLCGFVLPCTTVSHN